MLGRDLWRGSMCSSIVAVQYEHNYMQLVHPASINLVTNSLLTTAPGDFYDSWYSLRSSALSGLYLRVGLVPRTGPAPHPLAAPNQIPHTNPPPGGLSLFGTISGLASLKLTIYIYSTIKKRI
jgi:hypothetical protein